MMRRGELMDTKPERLMTELIEMSEREYFASVGERPGMFIGRSSFHALTSFLTGYDQSSARHGAPGLSGWREWLVARRGQDCNHAWPGQVLHMIAGPLIRQAEHILASMT
jgi:hypothetical protein